YTGCAWIDFDNDGDLDLSVAGKGAIFRNEGGGDFHKLGGIMKKQGQAQGMTWADYDNDGDIDCYLIGNAVRGSFLYRNDGPGNSFVKILSGVIADSLENSGWGGAWGEFTGDEYVDLVIAAANGFGGVTHENRLFSNNGDGTFTRETTSDVEQGLGPYTVPTWYDYDQDLDMDLFIAAGPASGNLEPDYLYRNDAGTLNRIFTDPIATDTADGQTWNWIDYDNDGDLDAYLTNYNSATPGYLYRNDAGTYARMTAATAGPIVSNTGLALSNHWHDYDNDGDVDCIITYDGIKSAEYYSNDGDGSFTKLLTTGATGQPGPNAGVAAADYDGDGDLDLFLNGSAASKALFRNDTANGNAWIIIECVGAGGPGGSNLSALGTAVYTKANIGGGDVWQQRQVVAQNAFNSHSMLATHFGLGDAAVVDSVIVRFPSGAVTTLTDVAVNQKIIVTELIATDVAGGATVVPTRHRLFQNVPNPFNPTTAIRYELAAPSRVTLRVFDVRGREVTGLVDAMQARGEHFARWNGTNASGEEVASGVYFYRLEVRDLAADDSSAPFRTTNKMLLVK
ncbi:MAG: hypothetical protein HKN20_11805, partial [Gemmatimonadetes bacterium]|nr:hypothetical protein [Gemmatimonadota bacterium]